MDLLLTEVFFDLALLEGSLDFYSTKVKVFEKNRIDLL